jgi:hypothetical protein
MGKVWIVFGESGEYEEYRNWDVKAFETKQEAEAFCAAANLIVKYHPDVVTSEYGEWKHPLDPRHYADDGDVDYRYGVSCIPFNGKLASNQGEIAGLRSNILKLCDEIVGLNCEIKELRNEADKWRSMYEGRGE